MNDDPRDRRLEEAYRDASTETPSPELDARILAAAHRAVQARPEDAARRPGWVARYRVPLSVAATVVIAVTVSLLVEDETRRAPEADAPVSAPRSDAPWGSRATTAPPPPAAAPAPADETRTITPPAAMPQRAPEAPAAPIRQLDVASPAASVPPQDAGRPLGAPAARESVERSAVPAADANVTAVPAPPRSTGRAIAPPQTAPAGAPGIESRERAAEERPSRMSRDEATTDGGRAAVKAAASPRSPEAWLEEIRRLRAEGRLADADEALAAFRRAYPDYPLPADLAPR
jgi:hypothetical protein